MMRLIVAGSRDLRDYVLVCRYLDHFLAGQLPRVLIISGGQRGADALGERYAEERGLEFVRFPADWSRHGRRAGPLRNEQMAHNADACVVFDGDGPGSRSMVEIANRRSLPLRVVPVRV